MKSKPRNVLFLVLSFFLICNIANLWVSKYIQYANAGDLDLSQVLNPPTVISGTFSTVPPNLGNVQGITATAQGISATAQGLTSVNGFCDPSTTSHATLTVNKVVLNPDGTTRPNDQQLFRVNVGNNFVSGGSTQAFDLSVPNPLSICLIPGSFFVVENAPLPAGFQWAAPVYQIAISNGVPSTIADRCFLQNVLAGQQITCTIINKIISNGTNQNIISAPSGVQKRTASTPTIGTAQGIGRGGPTSTEAAIGNQRNPPFQTCAANAAETVTTVTNGESTSNPKVVRLPSSATYVIKGVVSLDKVKSAMNEFDNTKILTIVIKSDLQSEDGVLLGLASPQYTGEIIVENKDGSKQKDITFRLSAVQTECKFITLARAFGPAPNTNVAPLGAIGNLKPNQIAAPAIDKELIGGITVGTGTQAQGLVPKVLNPPFAACQQPNPPNAELPSDNLALYIIRGAISNTAQLSGQTLAVLLTADLMQADTDLAKIVKTHNNDANNPFLIANLIANENKNNAHKIDFTLHDVNTDCKQISFTTNSIFTPITGSLRS
jgi:hypothetical protein